MSSTIIFPPLNLMHLFWHARTCNFVIASCFPWKKRFTWAISLTSVSNLVLSALDIFFVIFATAISKGDCSVVVVLLLLRFGNNFFLFVFVKRAEDSDSHCNDLNVLSVGGNGIGGHYAYRAFFRAVFMRLQHTPFLSSNSQRLSTFLFCCRFNRGI